MSLIYLPSSDLDRVMVGMKGNEPENPNWIRHCIEAPNILKIIEFGQNEYETMRLERDVRESETCWPVGGLRRLVAELGDHPLARRIDWESSTGMVCITRSDLC